LSEPYKALALVSQAIKETGSTDLTTISFKLDELLDRELSNAPSYKTLQPKSKCSRIETRMKKIGIRKTSDVQRMIEEAQASA
jgi:hypothetical protein